MIEAGGHGAVAAAESYISLYTRNQELTRNGTSPHNSSNKATPPNLPPK